MGSKGRYLGQGALLAAGALTTTLAAEMRAAIRHKFIASEPILEIGGVLGPDDGEPFTVAVLGDSSVAGVGAERAEDTLAYGVAMALAEGHRVTLHCLGVSGARLANVVDEQVPPPPGPPPSLPPPPAPPAGGARRGAAPPVPLGAGQQRHHRVRHRRRGP